jgi:uncharacterized Tic20 family protein
MTQTPNNVGGPQAPPPPQPPGPVPVPPGGPQLVGPENDSARSMAMLIHLLAIFTGWLVPLILWLVKKDESPFINQQGKEVVNFELTLMIGVVAGIATACIFVGFIILLGVSVVNIVFGIIGTIAVNKGQPYRFPVCIRFIK